MCNDDNRPFNAVVKEKLLKLEKEIDSTTEKFKEVWKAICDLTSLEHKNDTKIWEALQAMLEAKRKEN